MNSIRIVATLLVLGASPTFAQVVCEQDEQHIVIKRDGKHVLTYNKTDAVPDGVDIKYRRSGFIHPITTPSGRILTDDYPVPHHTHQHGLFFAWRKATFEGEELNFWEVGDDGATVRHDKVLKITNEDALAGFQVRLLHVLREQEILHETWTVRVDGPTGHIDLTSEQICVADSPLTLQRYHYGAMAIRGSRQWFKDAKDEFVGPCKMLTNESLTQKDGNHSRPTWVAMTGAIDGKPVAITLIPHPSNFRHPQHVRLHPDMPYFCFIPTVEEAFQLKPGEPWVSRYRMVVEDGEPNPGKLNKAQSAFALE